MSVIFVHNGFQNGIGHHWGISFGIKKAIFFSLVPVLIALVKDERVRERITQEVECINKKLGKWEQIKVFDLTPDEWSIDGGHLTPTLKLKRRIILEKYKDMYKTFYNKES